MGAPSKNQQWLDQVKEAALEPELPICDPHHHLWDQRHEREAERYLLDEILDDIAGGHNVVSTVFIECGAMFKTDGPEAYRCVGETEFVNGIAAMSASGMYGKARIAAGIVGTADLRLGDKVADVLDAQIAAGGGRFCGIRRGAFWHASPQIANHRTEPPEHVLLHDDFQAGFKHLAPRKLSFEVWCAHTQLPDAIGLARKFPDTAIVLDHFGGPIGMGPYAGKQSEVFAYWKTQIDELAKCQNVYAKLGGLNMAVNGYGWEHKPKPPTSTGAGDAQLFRLHDRPLRPQPLHVRVELPGRQAFLQLHGAVELVQAADQGLFQRRTRGDVSRHGGEGLPSVRHTPTRHRPRKRAIQ